MKGNIQFEIKFNFLNKRQMLGNLVGTFDLNLSGLKVYTEAASGAYLLAPILAALAGAERVYAQAKTTRYGEAIKVIEDIRLAAEKYGVSDKIVLFEGRSHEYLSDSDIITNSGFVRPVDRDLISVLKPSAVIPLMWETWEFRTFDFDLDYCKERGILVLGTKELEDPCNMIPFISWLGLRLLFDLGFDGGKILLLGSPTPSRYLVKQFRDSGMDVTWVSTETESDLKYDKFNNYFHQNGHLYDILILCEHLHHFPLLGKSGLVSYEEINAINPDLRIGVISGNVSAAELQTSGLTYLPEHIAPVGLMSYQPYLLGFRPVLVLFAGGLKVGQEMARARLKGLNPRDAAAKAIKKSPAMDFLGGLKWL